MAKGANKDLRVTIVDLHGDVFYGSCNETFQKVFNNHISRQETRKVLKNEKGYDLKCTSEIAGIPYLYSATLYPHYIICSVLSYNVDLINGLAANQYYL